VCDRFQSVKLPWDQRVLRVSGIEHFGVAARDARVSDAQLFPADEDASFDRRMRRVSKRVLEQLSAVRAIFVRSQTL
jgi:hypothetical protein